MRVTQGGSGPMRVVLAEDSVLLREGLVRLLEEAGTEVVAAVGDGPSLVRAVLAPGHGLAGLADRLQAVDGVLSVDSPRGGPTRLIAELPCG